MTELEQADIVRIIDTQLAQFTDMKKRAERSDSPFMTGEAVGAIIALEQVGNRLNQYFKSK